MENSVFKIRRGTSQDAPVLASLRSAIFRETGQAMTPEENAIFETACDTAFAESIEKGGCYAWLAENQSNEIIGSAVLLLFPRLPSPKRFQLHEGYLINVFTLPEWRRRGVATALVQAVVAKARELGLARIRLHATSDGQPIYKALGFENRPEAMELNL